MTLVLSAGGLARTWDWRGGGGGGHNTSLSMYFANGPRLSIVRVRHGQQLDMIWHETIGLAWLSRLFSPRIAGVSIRGAAGTLGVTAHLNSVEETRIL